MAQTLTDKLASDAAMLEASKRANYMKQLSPSSQFSEKLKYWKKEMEDLKNKYPQSTIAEDFPNIEMGESSIRAPRYGKEISPNVQSPVIANAILDNLLNEYRNQARYSDPLVDTPIKEEAALYRSFPQDWTLSPGGLKTRIDNSDNKEKMLAAYEALQNRKSSERQRAEQHNEELYRKLNLPVPR